MITKTLFDCAIIVTILFSLCNNNKFAEGVLKESQGRFDRNKKFIYDYFKHLNEFFQMFFFIAISKVFIKVTFDHVDDKDKDQSRDHGH